MGKKKIVEQKGESGAKETVATKTKTSKAHKAIDSGRIYINSSYNNTSMTVTDDKGGVIAWATAGSMGFGGPRKSTPFAASKIAAAIAEKIAKTGPMNVDVFVSGVGPGRDSAIRSLVNFGFNLLSIRDVTPIPHNGPKPPKVRRV